MARLEPLAGVRRNKETERAIIACNDYLRLGPGRSIRKLLTIYEAKAKPAPAAGSNQDPDGPAANGNPKPDGPETAVFGPPSLNLGTLKKWSSRYHWGERAALYDTEREQEKTEAQREIMETGLALDFERVKKLKQLADTLETELYTRGENGRLSNLWLKDVKIAGNGDGAREIEIFRYNAALVRDFMSVLDDLAKETGGRVKNKNIVHSWRENVPDHAQPLIDDFFKQAVNEAAKRIRENGHN